MTTERAIFLKIGSTPARVASLSAEEQILCDLVGLPGVLQLLWSEIAPGHAVVATEPMLGTIYDQAGRQLALDLILSLADQLLSRLGLIHSRSISHGNVTPHASPLNPNIGFIRQWESWVGEDKPLQHRGPLYDALHLRVAKIEKETSLPTDDAQGLRLLRSLSDALGLYMNILLQKPMTRQTRQTRQTLLPKAYDLPGRLWRDLRWYLAAVAGATVDFQKHLNQDTLLMVE
ncbi:hypothetical protein CIRG_00161 [Coccidioides immitis RMSCC 2394]|uniref:Protein kinase domain-containing protein n=1 Tax=Coccidioides immitis RMSCC 2394 TaxID=404692 RepID=A0A0J6XZ47_COCIT|nr:hypothetical protein CIRG_00161 [Coccidioides immitis RMSCC 2394]